MEMQIAEGARVLYYQPGVDGILASWSGKPRPQKDPGSSLVEATITGVSCQFGETHYTTAEGIILEASDIREVLG